MGLSLTKPEISRFMERNSSSTELMTYLRTPSFRPYGLIIYDLNRPMLVYIAPNDRLYISDISDNLTLVEDVKKAPYKSGDARFLQNIQKDINKTFSGTDKLLYFGAVLIGLVAVANITKHKRNPSSDYEDTSREEIQENPKDSSQEIDRIRQRFREGLHD